MKLRLTLMIVALAIPASGATAQNATGPTVPNLAHYGTYGAMGMAPGNQGPVKATPGLLRQIRIQALRHEALELQREDGGTLTPEHHAMLQAKLDRINAQTEKY